MMFLAPRGTFPVAGVLFRGRGRVGGRMGRVSARLASSHHVTVVLDHMLKQNLLNSSSTNSYRKYEETFIIDPSRILKRPVIKINGGSTPHITKVWDQDITTI